MQLSRTLPRVPQDLFRWKKEKMEERLSRIGKPQSKCSSAAALHKKPPCKRQAGLIVAPKSKSIIPIKRLRIMTARMDNSDAQLQMLRQSLSRN